MNLFIRGAIIASLASLGLWSGSTAALHFEEPNKVAKKIEESIILKLPPLILSVAINGDTTTMVHAHYSVSIPKSLGTTPQSEDMLSDALLTATMKTFSDGKNHQALASKKVASLIANYANEKLGTKGLDELQISDLSVYNFSPNKVRKIPQ